MKLSHSQRLSMIQVTQDMLNRLEDHCQRQYASIAYHQDQIKAAQTLLERLEGEYVKTAALLDRLKGKLND